MELRGFSHARILKNFSSFPAANIYNLKECGIGELRISCIVTVNQGSEHNQLLSYFVIMQQGKEGGEGGRLSNIISRKLKIKKIFLILTIYFL